MKELSEHYEIARLIAAKIAETITSEEMVKLDAWLAEDERHRERFSRIQKRLKKDEENNVFRNPEEVLKDMERVKKELSLGKSTLLWGHHFFRYAAVVVLMIGVAATLLWQPWGKQDTEMSQLSQQEMISPGSSKVILTLASGEQVDLEDIGRDSLHKDGVLIQKRVGELAYEQVTGRMQQGEVFFNKITIPRGGEYKLTLSDGTRVWLNSATELKFPVKFAGDSRQVFLEGEAYFEVAPDVEHPFMVNTSGVNVKVLGTGFDVMAYPGDTEATVTLVHGKVEVGTNDKETILRPGEQLEYNRTIDSWEVREVDVRSFIAWKEGFLVFDVMPLEELAKKLGRWYDVDFVFASEEFKQLKFTGTFKKEDDIRRVLDLINTTTRIQFKLQGRTITVCPE